METDNTSGADDFLNSNFGSFNGIDDDNDMPLWRKNESINKPIPNRHGIKLDVDKVIVEDVYDDVQPMVFGHSQSLANSQHEQFDLSHNRQPIQSTTSSIAGQKEYEMRFSNTDIKQGGYQTQRDENQRNQYQNDPSRRNTYIESESIYELDPHILDTDGQDMTFTSANYLQSPLSSFNRSNPNLKFGMKNSEQYMSVPSITRKEGVNRNSVQDLNQRPKVIDDTESQRPNAENLLSLMDDHYALRTSRNNDFKSEFDFDDGASHFSTMDIDLEEIEDRIMELNETVEQLIESKDSKELFKINLSAYSIEKAKIQSLIFKFKSVRAIRDDEEKINYIYDQEDQLQQIQMDTFELVKSFGLATFFDSQEKEQNSKFGLEKLEDQSKQVNEAYDSIKNPMLEIQPMKQMTTKKLPNYFKKLQKQNKKLGPVKNIDISMQDGYATSRNPKKDRGSFEIPKDQRKRSSQQDIDPGFTGARDIDIDNLTPRNYNESYHTSVGSDSNINYIDRVDQKVQNLQKLAQDVDKQERKKQKMQNSDWLKDIKEQIKDPQNERQDNQNEQNIQNPRYLQLDTIPEGLEIGSHVYTSHNVSIADGNNSVYKAAAKLDQAPLKAVHVESVASLLDIGPEASQNSTVEEIISAAYNPHEKLINNSDIECQSPTKKHIQKRRSLQEVPEPAKEKCCCQIF